MRYWAGKWFGSELSLEKWRDWTASGAFCQIENLPHFEFQMQSGGAQLSPVLVIDIFHRTFSESFTLSPLGKFDQMVWVDQPKKGFVNQSVTVIISGDASTWNM